MTAQSRDPLRLAGRVVRVRGADSTAMAGATVVAHVVSPERQGPFDSARTDATGRFAFRVSAPESAAAYVVSAAHAGVGYFSEPFTAAARRGADAITLVVYDTATSGPPLGIAIRHVVVERAGPDGSRRVLDLVQVHNADLTTRVARDSLEEVWSLTLPAGASGATVAEGEVPETAVRFAQGRALVAAAFPPGQKQLVFSYVLPARARTLELPVDQATSRLEVLVEETGTAASPNLVVGAPVTLEGRTFAHFGGSNLAPGQRAVVRFARGAGSVPWWIAVVAAAAVLAAGLVLGLRRGPRPAIVKTEATPGTDAGSTGAPSVADLPTERLLAAIVALDGRYQGREAEVGAEEWAGYRRRRAELKAQLARKVAPGGEVSPVRPADAPR